MIKLSITTKEVNRVAQKVTSTDIKLALKEFHNGKPSYFITECKTCSTYFPDPQGLLKLDGLAITKSYTNTGIIPQNMKSLQRKRVIRRGRFINYHFTQTVYVNGLSYRL